MCYLSGEEQAPHSVQATAGCGKLLSGSFSLDKHSL